MSLKRWQVIKIIESTFPSSKLKTSKISGVAFFPVMSGSQIVRSPFSELAKRASVSVFPGIHELSEEFWALVHTKMEVLDLYNQTMKGRKLVFSPL